MSIAASSSSMDDDMKGCLIQLEEKIAQLTKIVFKLVIPLMQAQALATPIAKLSLMFGDEDHSTRRMNDLQVSKISLQTFKIEARIKIPIYNVTVDA